MTVLQTVALASLAIGPRMRDSGKIENTARKEYQKKCPETELNRRHADFQSAALPTELSGHKSNKQENYLINMN